MKAYTGINIQYPISQLIIDGSKTIETRTYPIPSSYVNRDLLLIETPGPKGKFKARAVAIIRFSGCRRYLSKEEFYSEYKFHRVSADSPWAWQEDKGKWGWQIAMVKKLKLYLTMNKRLGIRFTHDLRI